MRIRRGGDLDEEMSPTGSGGRFQRVHGLLPGRNLLEKLFEFHPVRPSGMGGSWAMIWVTSPVNLPAALS